MANRKPFDLRATLLASIAGGLAYVATMEIDNRKFDRDLDDLKLLGWPLTGGEDDARIAGLPVHLANSVALGLFYAGFARNRLPGPAWLKGLGLVLVENTVLYPITFFEEMHPGVRSGAIARYCTLQAFLQTFPRHFAYGIVMATLYERLALNAEP